MNFVENVVEDVGEGEEDPATPKHPPSVGCRDEAGPSSIDNRLVNIQDRVGDSFASHLIIHNVCHGHGRPDRQP